MIAIELKTAFEQIVGADGIVAYTDSDLVSLVRRSLAQPDQDYQISWVIYPATSEQLAEAIALAHQSQIQVLICGSGSKLDWGGLVKFSRLSVVISTARLNHIIEHAVGDLTVTCEAGVKFGDLQAVLAKSGQFLAIDPAYAAESTLGGILATANTGSLRQRYGGVRDMCLGVSFVRADGKSGKAGGRVVKNVAGYDLMKLLTGSFGSLAVVAQVTFRVYPLPQSDRTIFLTGDPQAIAVAHQQILSSALTPVALDLISGNLWSGSEVGIGLLVRFAGITAGVEEQTRRLVALSEKLGIKAELVPTSIWSDLETQLWSQDSSQDSIVICKIGILPNQAVSILLAIQSTIQHAIQNLEITINPRLHIHAASGLGTLHCQMADLEVMALYLSKVRDLAHATGGFLTILAAPSSLKQKIDVWGYTGNAIAVMRALKQQFDPEQVLNPHRFIE